MDEEEDTGWDENKPLGHSAGASCPRGLFSSQPVSYSSSMYYVFYTLKTVIFMHSNCILHAQ